MANASVNFFSEDTTFEPDNKPLLKSWIKACIQAEKNKIKEINFIFCSDAYLLGLNQTYLSHNTFTDVISFDHSEKRGVLEGDIFISYPRVEENAEIYGQKEEDELHRVMIHGVLHLCGYGDKTEKEKNRIKEKENYFLSKRQF